MLRSHPYYSLFGLFTVSGVLLLLFSPFLLGPDPRIIPSRYPDASEVVWTIWLTQQFVAGIVDSIYRTDLLFHPYGTSLLLHATVEAISLPLSVLFEDQLPTRLYTISCALCFLLNYLTSVRLFFLLSNRPLFSIGLAVLFCCHPFYFAHLDAGQLNFLCFFPVILGFDACIRMGCGARKSLEQMLILGTSVALLAFINLYYLYFSLMGFVLLTALMLAWKQSHIRGVLLTILLPICCGLICASPKLIGVWKLAGGNAYTENHRPSDHSADLAGYALPGPYQRLGVKLFPEAFEGIRVNAGEAVTYAGIGLIILLLVTFRADSTDVRSFRQRLRLSLLWMAFFFLLLSFGPFLQLSGEVIGRAWVYQVFQLLPAFPSVPVRFAGMVIFLLFAAAAIVPEQYRIRRSVLCGLFLLIGFEYWPVPLYTRGIPSSPVLQELSADRAVDAVVDMHGTPWEAMIRQTEHGKKLVGGFLSRRPRVAERRYRHNAFLKYLEAGGVPPPDGNHDWEKLAAQLVILPNVRTDSIERIRMLGDFRLRASDEHIHIFEHIAGYAG